MKHSSIPIFLVVVLFISIVTATIIHVPGDQPTIQAGIDAATDGDTVLVDTGRYVENINFNGKNLVLGSLFLVTGDTSYISQTVIDGNRKGSVVTFENGEDTTSVLSGFSITNGVGRDNMELDWLEGGGILCSSASPTLENLIITDNHSGGGGGIHMNDSNPILRNMILHRNTGWMGGALYCEKSNPILENLSIKNNSAQWGGGIHSYKSELTFTNVTISHNSSNWTGEDGGGGGIYFWESSASFSSDNRCNIYLNQAVSEQGGDLYARNSPVIQVVVDTFTVKDPNAKHAFPLENFTFDILNDKMLSPLEGDIYVSPSGNDGNTGLSPSYPLRHLSTALAMIRPNSQNPATIYLFNGTYSPSSGEAFPLIIPSYVTLFGESREGVIFDAERKTRVTFISSKNGITIENVTIKNGKAGGEGSGGGIRCTNSSVRLINVTVTGNIAPGTDTNGGSGGGIFCEGSKLSLSNVEVSNNVADWGEGGGIICLNSTVDIDGLVLKGNSGMDVGGIYSYRSYLIMVNSVVKGHREGAGVGVGSYSSRLENVVIVNNPYSGIYSFSGSPQLINSTITGNGTGVVCERGSHPTLVNSIVWGNRGSDIILEGDSDSITVAYSDVGRIRIDDNGTINQLEGNIDEDPLFVSSRDFHLQEGSPAIDAGTPLFVLDNDTLVNMSEDDYVGSAPDMGAFEYGAFDLVFPYDNSTINITQHNAWTDTLYFAWGQSGYPVTYSFILTDGLSLFNLGETTINLVKVPYYQIKNTMHTAGIEIATGTWTIVASDGTMNVQAGNGPFTLTIDASAVGIDEADLIPEAFALQQNYPNPFNPTTTIQYDLPRAGHVSLTIYDILGRQVEVAVDSWQEAGTYSVSWDASGVPTGIYFVRMMSGTFSQVRKVMVLR